jgi:hypothetical protein
MTKRTIHGLAVMLLATPLVLVGCSDSGDKDGGTAGNGGLKYDGAAGAGGTRDGGPALEVSPPPVDTQVAVDTTVPVDTTLADAPMVPDAPVFLDVAPVLDVALVDTRPAVLDTAALEAAIDTTPAVDVTPALTCTETTKFAGGTVAADRTLTQACSPYSIKNSINVNTNAILTIEAGVTLNMGTDTEIVVGSSSAGKLVANGTAANPITFTSPTAGAGDWNGIQFWGSTITGSSISYATVDYCGQDRACIHGEGGVKTGRVTIDHVTIDHVGPNSNAIKEKDADSNFAISNCTFKNIPAARYAISVDGESFAGIDSTNAFNGAAIELAGGDISATTTWKNPGTSVIVTYSLYVDGAPAPTLTIAAGTKLFFVQEMGVVVGSSKGGILKVAGTATDLVTMTSANTPPAAGDWNGIFLWDGGQASIDYATISYGGNITTGTTSGDICVEGEAKLTISNSTLSNSSGYGVWIRCGSLATVTDTTVTYDPSNVSGAKGPGPDETAAACQ